MADEVEKTVKFLAQGAHSFGVKIGKVRYQAQKGVLELPESVANELKTLMKTRPDIRSVLFEINEEAAIAQVKKHMAAQGKQAVQGPFASDNGPKATIRNANDEVKKAPGAAENSSVNTATQPVEVKEIKTDAPPQGGNVAARLGLK